MAGGPLVSESVKKRVQDKVVGYLQTMTDEKTSEIAWPYEPTKGWPAIVYMSSRGVIIEKTFKFVKEDDLVARLDALAEKAKPLDEELAKLEAAVEKDQTDLKALDALCAFWTKHGNWREALPLLEKLVKASENGSLAKESRFQRWLELGRARAVTHGYEEAIKEAEAIVQAATAAKLLAAAQAAHVLEGFCREQQGDTKAARECYERCVAIDATSKFGKQAQASIDRLKSTSSAEDDK